MPKKKTVDNRAFSEGKSDALNFYRKLSRSDFGEWWYSETGEDLDKEELERAHSDYLSGYAGVKGSEFQASIRDGNRWSYVSDLPGEDGVNWGYSSSSDYAKRLTFDQAFEFAEYQRELDRKAHITRLSSKKKNPEDAGEKYDRYWVTEPAKMKQFDRKADATKAAYTLGFPKSDVTWVDVMGFKLWVIGNPHGRYLSKVGYNVLMTEAFYYEPRY